MAPLPTGATQACVPSAAVPGGGADADGIHHVRWLALRAGGHAARPCPGPPPPPGWPAQQRQPWAVGWPRREGVKPTPLIMGLSSTLSPGRAHAGGLPSRYRGAMPTSSRGGTPRGPPRALLPWAPQEPTLPQASPGLQQERMRFNPRGQLFSTTQGPHGAGWERTQERRRLGTSETLMPSRGSRKQRNPSPPRGS